MLSLPSKALFLRGPWLLYCCVVVAAGSLAAPSGGRLPSAPRASRDTLAARISREAHGGGDVRRRRRSGHVGQRRLPTGLFSHVSRMTLASEVRCHRKLTRSVLRPRFCPRVPWGGRKSSAAWSGSRHYVQNSGTAASDLEEIAPCLAESAQRRQESAEVTGYLRLTVRWAAVAV